MKGKFYYKINNTALVSRMKFILMWFFSLLFGIDQKSIVFISSSGSAYSDNPRAISERLYEIDKNFKIIWLFLDPSSKKSICPSYVRMVRKQSIQALRVLSTSKYWVNNVPMHNYVYKNKRQTYIQTEHGDRSLKKFGLDVKPKHKFVWIESKICDLFIVGSHFGESIMKSGFGYNGKFLRVGCPRNDKLINTPQKQITNMKRDWGINESTMVLTYAPTFRDELREKRLKQSIQQLDLLSIIEHLEKKYNKKWICFVRSHILSHGIEGITHLDNVLLDGNQFEDMSDLLVISDMLITDYSSCAGDFILMNKPVVLYQPDEESYNIDRGLYFKSNDLPFLVAKDNIEILSIIQNLNQEDTINNCEKVLDFYGVYESGYASEKIVNYIIGH